jgi:hypothetical protein
MLLVIVLLLLNLYATSIASAVPSAAGIGNPSVPRYLHHKPDRVTFPQDERHANVRFIFPTIRKIHQPRT